MIRVRIRNVTVNDGAVVNFPESGVICIVGGNNVGKSQFLRELKQQITDPREESRLITTKVEIRKPNIDENVAQDFLQDFPHIQTPPGVPHQYYSFGDRRAYSTSDFISYFNNYADGILAVNNFFITGFPAGEMKGIATQQASFSSQGQVNHLSAVYEDATVEKTISELSLNTFGLPLLFSRLRDDERFRVGTISCETPTMDKISKEYVNEIKNLPTLDEQGDGMKSFIGLVTAILTGKEQMLLVDEPEAFLHPPQAKALGRWVGKQNRNMDKQLFFATHDSNFLLGLLESGSPISLIHLTREGKVNHLYDLDTRAVQEAWNDPVLHYSNVLQGLFCRQVVICEADADCRFFHASLSELSQENGVPMASDETLFVPSGGKSHISSFAGTLSPLHVKLFAILDFDILRVKKDIKNVVESFGFDWDTSIDELYMNMAREVSGAQQWDSLKHSGLNGMNSGGPYKNTYSLMKRLADYGIIILSCGELEDLDKDIASEGSSGKPLHGAAWVNAMLKSGRYKTNDIVRDAITPLLSTFVDSDVNSMANPLMP